MKYIICSKLFFAILFAIIIINSIYIVQAQESPNIQSTNIDCGAKIQDELTKSGAENEHLYTLNVKPGITLNIRVQPGASTCSAILDVFDADYNRTTFV